MSIAEVIGWKFNNQSGMTTIDGVITEFPRGIPSQADQDTWTTEYEAYKIMADIRAERNALLAETDWWGASDNSMSDEQTAYRLALRDYPATYTADNTADWPTKP